MLKSVSQWLTRGLSKVFTAVAIASSLTLTAVAEEAAELPPLDPAYVGIHGMALMNKNSTVFASHMPLYKKPHDVQLIYKLKMAGNLALSQLVKHNDLVTIKPEKFNLQRLMRGEEIVLKADVYLGHFERDGELIYPDMDIVFDELLFVRELKELEPSSNSQSYELVSYNSKSDRLLVHKIQQAPSYDHILHVDLTSGCPQTIRTSSATPRLNELLSRFLHCGTLKPLYYEIEDFKPEAKSEYH